MTDTLKPRPECLNRVRRGYAKDLIDSIDAGTASLQDSDSLFRTLVLDLNWPSADAAEVYYWALEKLSTECLVALSETEIAPKRARRKAR